MPDTTTPSPPSATGARPELDASVDALVASARSARGESAGAAARSISPESLDAVLAETAQELADAEPSAGAEGFHEFADPSTVLGEAVVAPEIDLDRPLPEERAVSAEVATDVRSPAEDGSADVEDAAPALPHNVEAEAQDSRLTAGERNIPSERPVDATDDLDFADPASLMEEVSRELEAATEEAGPLSKPPLEEPSARTHTSPSESTEGARREVAEPEPRADAEPVTEAARVPHGARPTDRIEELDQVLAADAEKVLATAGETPRIASSPVAPEAEAAPAEPEPAPRTPPATPTPAAAPIAEPAVAATEPEESTAAAEPKPRRRLRPLLAHALNVLLAPLVRVNGRLSHTARQTIGYAAIITLFNCTWVWGYVLLRAPGELPAPAGEGAPFVKPGDPLPSHGGGQGGSHGESSTSGRSAPASGKSDGHGGSSGKKKDDGHGSSSKSASKSKKPAKKEASAAHH